MHILCFRLQSLPTAAVMIHRGGINQGKLNRPFAEHKSRTLMRCAAITPPRQRLTTEVSSSAY